MTRRLGRPTIHATDEVFRQIGELGSAEEARPAATNPAATGPAATSRIDAAAKPLPHAKELGERSPAAVPLTPAWHADQAVAYPAG